MYNYIYIYIYIYIVASARTTFTPLSIAEPRSGTDQPEPRFCSVGLVPHKLRQANRRAGPSPFLS